MDNRKASSSFTVDLFGPNPKHSSPPSSSSSTGIFGSVFGPSSTGLGKDSAHSRKHDSAAASQYGTAGKHATSTVEYSGDSKTQSRSKGSEGGSKYNQTNETVVDQQPCYLSSSIYYGGQEAVYSPRTNSNHTLKKDGGDEDSNGNGASRGNWWQGSLYY